MKTKKWLALLLAILLMLCACSCDSGSRGGGGRSSGSDTASPLLYKITDDDGNVVWLLGSIHVGKDEFYPLPDYITDALEGADAVAVEYDVIAANQNIQALYSSQQKCKYSYGDSIRNHIPESLYEKAVEELKDLGIYSSTYNSYIPAFWSILIEQSRFPDGAMDLGVDRHIINTAYDLDLPIYDIESADLQYAMLASFSEELQVLLLEMALKNSASEYRRNLDRLMDAWLSGDKEGIYDYVCRVPDGLTDEEEELYEEYLKKSLTNRDKGMTDFIIDALDDGEEVFVCVGAAHVVGDGGIIDQLRDAGYTVKLVN